MAKDLLLEIGTEEIPAHFMPAILAQLEKAAASAFSDLRIAYETIKVVGTPRRIALMMSGVAEQQSDNDIESKGPSVQVAFDSENKPTKAAIGFARGKKIAVEDLVIKDGYIYAMVHEVGQPTAELLPQALPQLITALSFPKNMRWADLTAKFVRPVKWFVALYGSEVVPFTLFNVPSGRNTRGHRFLSQGELIIENAADYLRVMDDAFVVVDPKERRRRIRTQIEELAAKQGGQAEITEDLLEEVTFLVEYPTALCGRFEEKYLKLPPETVITPMREHQRYFPVKDAFGKLLPLFITVRNGGSEYLQTVQHGNERVLRARLADAQFFFEEDRKIKLSDRVEKLKTVVFQEGLGTMYDKTQRLIKLGEFICNAVGQGDLAVVKRAAQLAKADLVTGMVCEFTELQGVMGREYALLDGESEQTAAAIYEHYLPRFAGDALPTSAQGRIVSLADKLDNIVATFSRGLVPTGSQDPYALRRQALGCVNTLLAAGYSLSLRALTEYEMDLLAITDTAKRTEIMRNVREFFGLRMKNVLADENVRYDIVDAVMAGELDDACEVYRKAHTLADYLTKQDMTKDIQAFVRVANLAQKADGSGEVEESLLQSGEETALYRTYQSCAAAAHTALAAKEYAAVIDALRKLTPAIEAFFEKVMVMDKDERIKQNRLALLQNITALTAKIADFGKIVLA